MKILLVEDDHMLGNSLQKALRLENYTTEWVQDGEAAEVALDTSEFSLVILDLNLPVLNGLDLLKLLRKKGNQVPILILTAKDAITSKIQGLDLGADDYMSKPFDLSELIARIRALMRRSKGIAELLIKCGDVELNHRSKMVNFDGENISLPAKEYKILAYLMESAGRIVSKSQIEELVYGWDEEFESNTVEVFIYKLRKKFGSDFIKTIRNMGYTIAK